jgi:hypothetical protein
MNVHDVAAALPEVSVLRDRCRAIAMLEAVVSPDWASRYYSFDAAWADGEEMASMRNGSGDEYSIVFGSVGAFIRGFDHESPMSPANNDGHLWPGLVEGIPEAFTRQVNEPAFSYDGVLSATFCLWRQPDDSRWQTGTIDFPDFGGYREDPDGSAMIAILCSPGPDAYLAFASDYYETTLDPVATARVWALRPLDDATVATLNPDLTLADVQEDASAIGYPND